jgi:hypothetical protein
MVGAVRVGRLIQLVARAACSTSSGVITWSCLDTRYQLGIVFQAGSTVSALVKAAFGGLPEGCEYA